MSESCIGKERSRLYAKLQDSLAGPFEAILPLAWIEAALAETGRSFRASAFSPLSHALGHDRAVVESRSHL